MPAVGRHWLETGTGVPTEIPSAAPFSLPNHSTMAQNRAWLALRSDGMVTQAQCHSSDSRFTHFTPFYLVLGAMIAVMAWHWPLLGIGVPAVCWHWTGTGHWSARLQDGTGHCSASCKCDTPVPSPALCARWSVWPRYARYDARARGSRCYRMLAYCLAVLGLPLIVPCGTLELALQRARMFLVSSG